MTIYGWDMSNWDAPSIGDAVAEGFAYFTHKAGGDTSGGDQELVPWWQDVKGTDPAKTLLGTYWVPRPDMYPNPASEAERWLATIDARCPGWRDRPHILQVDAERWPAGDQTKPTRSYIKALADRLIVRAPKLRPIVYASKGQYGDSLSGVGYPLWNADYPSSMTGAASAIYAHVGGDSGPGWAGYSGQTPAIWQFTSSATIAGQTTCDANAYRGTLAQLASLVAPGWKVDDMQLTDKIGSQAYSGRTVEDFLNDIEGLRDVLRGDPAGAKVAAYPSTAPLMQLLATPAQVAALSAKVDALTKAVAAVGTVAVTPQQLQVALVAALEQLAGAPAPATDAAPQG